jgi:hypothetical protein
MIKFHLSVFEMRTSQLFCNLGVLNLKFHICERQVWVIVITILLDSENVKTFMFLSYEGYPGINERVFVTFDWKNHKA